MIIIFMLLSLILPSEIFSQSSDTEYERVEMSNIFYKIDDGFRESFTHNNGINHFIAIAGTYVIVVNGVDWKIHEHIVEKKEIAYSGFPSVILGGLTPIVLSLGLYYYADKHQDKELQWTSLALGQAAILGLTISSAYKAVSGRRPPEILDDDSSGDEDFSQDFKFGFLNRGVFDGWPSGHTVVAFSMATTLAELYPDNKTVKYGAFTYASLVGIGVSTNIHWTTDAFAGALIGYSIGKSVGNNFRSKMNKDKTVDKYDIIVTPSTVGISFRF